jgi:hypothetical protein
MLHRAWQMLGSFCEKCAAFWHVYTNPSRLCSCSQISTKTAGGNQSSPSKSAVPGGKKSAREYWMIYRGPSFLAVVWFGSSSTPFPLSSLSFSYFLWVSSRSYGREGERVWGQGAKSCNTVSGIHSIVSDLSIIKLFLQEWSSKLNQSKTGRKTTKQCGEYLNFTSFYIFAYRYNEKHPNF